MVDTFRPTPKSTNFFRHGTTSVVPSTTLAPEFLFGGRDFQLRHSSPSDFRPSAPEGLALHTRFASHVFRRRVLLAPEDCFQKEPVVTASPQTLACPASHGSKTHYSANRVIFNALSMVFLVQLILTQVSNKESPNEPASHPNQLQRRDRRRADSPSSRIREARR